MRSSLDWKSERLWVVGWWFERKWHRFRWWWYIGGETERHPHHYTVWGLVLTALLALGGILVAVTTDWAFRGIGIAALVLALYVLLSFFGPLPLVPLWDERVVRARRDSMGEVISAERKVIETQQRQKAAERKEPLPLPDPPRVVRDIAAAHTAALERAAPEPSSYQVIEALRNEGRLLHQKLSAPLARFSQALFAQGQVAEWTDQVTREVKRVAMPHDYRDWLEAAAKTNRSVQGLADRITALDGLLARMRDRETRG
jgi:hypothetical protein